MIYFDTRSSSPVPWWRTRVGYPTRSLRCLDAIHVASAVQIMPALSTMLCYDQRMIDAAVQAGIPVASPGMRELD